MTELQKITQEIIKLHLGIIGSLRKSVEDAVKIGNFLTIEKDKMKHGEYLPWIKSMNIDSNTAERYRKLYIYKIPNVGNLQEAYEQIETIEQQEKQKENARKQSMINQYVSSGIKPKDWDRSLDYEYKKRIDNEAFQKRSDAAFNAKRNKQDETKKKYINSPASGIVDDIMNSLGNHIESEIKRKTFKESIRISHEGLSDPFIDAIMDYLETLNDDNRRIEACYNIIKVCKGIANSLQTIK
jgi:hypothetical protein